MQGFCDPDNGVKNNNGFLEYPNSTAKELLKNIQKIVDSDWSADIFKHENNSIKVQTLFDYIFDFKEKNGSRNNKGASKEDPSKVI